MRWGIIAAEEGEVALLKELLDNVEVREYASRKYFSGNYGTASVTVVQCGVGKVCAAMGTQILIDMYHVDAIINTGVAGALKDFLSVGDVVISTKTVQHDFDLRPFGYKKGCLGEWTESKEPTYFEADAGLRELFSKTAEKYHLTTAEGIIASGDVFVDSKELKREMVTLFDACAAEMEGAAVAHVASANHIPFLVIRAISDTADGGTDSYEAVRVTIMEAFVKIIAAMIGLEE